MNAKFFVAVAAVLSLVMPLRSDTPRPAPAAGISFEQTIAELKQIAELAQQLDDKSFAKRQDASERLMQMGKPAVGPLQRLLAAKPSLEIAKRIEAILREIKKQHRPKNKLRKVLTPRINLEKGIEGNTPLKDALDFLSDRYDLTFTMDEIRLHRHRRAEGPGTTGIFAQDGRCAVTDRFTPASQADPW